MRPTISVIIPTYNEAQHIERALKSILEQNRDTFELEILVIDGKSTDNTKEIVEAISRQNQEVKLFSNPQRRTPFAFNIGIKEAAGEYVAILGSHCDYKSDYLSVCLQELILNDAAGCSGKVLTAPANSSYEAKLSAWLLGSAFGVSSHSFRTQPEGFADSIPYPVYQKKLLLKIGGYNTNLYRNQDNLLNASLRAHGYQLYCTHKTYCHYYPKSTLRSTFQYAFNNGFWVAYSIKKHPDSMSLRHYIPFVFSFGVILGVVIILLYYLTNFAVFRTLTICFGISMILYFSLSIIQSAVIAIKNKHVLPFLLPVIFFIFHFLYGFGTLKGLFTPVHKFH